MEVLLAQGRRREAAEREAWCREIEGRGREIVSLLLNLIDYIPLVFIAL